MKHLDLRAVVFDAGNTLMHLDYPFIAGVLAEHGHAVAPLDIRVAEYGARAAIDRKLAPDAVPPASLEKLLWPDESGKEPSYFAVMLRGLGIRGAAETSILNALRQHNETMNLWRVVEPDTVAVLERLGARGYALAVVSNSDGRVEASLAAAGLRPHFATVIDSQVVGVEKPDPAIFALALDHLGVAPARAVYVGDVFGIDVQGARRAGMHPVLIDTLQGYLTPIDCPRVTGLVELLDLLPERAGS